MAHGWIEGGVARILWAGALLMIGCAHAPRPTPVSPDALALACVAASAWREVAVAVESRPIRCGDRGPRARCYRLTNGSGQMLDAVCWGAQCGEFSSHPLMLEIGPGGECRIVEPPDFHYERG